MDYELATHAQPEPRLDPGERPTRLLHVMLRVFNLQHSLDFYVGALGMQMLRRQDYPGGRFTLVFLGYGDEDSDTVVDITAILGGFDRRLTTPNFRGGEVTAIMGGCNLDLRASSIEGDAVINVFAVMGGITIKCPPDWTVVLQGTPIMGGFDEKTITPPNNAKRLIINGYAIMGGVEVRN